VTPTVQDNNDNGTNGSIGLLIDFSESLLYETMVKFLNFFFK